MPSRPGDLSDPRLNKVCLISSALGIAHNKVLSSSEIIGEIKLSKSSGNWGLEEEKRF